MSIQLIFLGAALAAATPNAADTTRPFDFVQGYLHELGALEEIRIQAEKDQTTSPTDMMSCIRNTEAWNLELGAAVNSFNRTHLHTDTGADDSPRFLADLYEQKRLAFVELGSICSKLATGPKTGVDYDSLVTQAPKLTARINYIDKSLFQASVMVFFTLISQKPDSAGHLSHLNITREERDRLMSYLKIEFGERLSMTGQVYAVQTAQIFSEKLAEYKCVDESFD